MDLEKIDKKLYYVGHPMINDTKILIEVIKEINTEIERLKTINYKNCSKSDSKQLSKGMRVSN